MSGFDCGQCGSQCDMCASAERAAKAWHQREASGLVSAVALALFIGMIVVGCAVLA